MSDRVSVFNDDFFELIDQVKGVAILWVIGFHAAQIWFGWQGVHVFIVLSGMMLGIASLERSRHQWSDWLRRRAIRILPEYIVTVLAGALLTGLLGLWELNLPGVTWTSAWQQVMLDCSLLRNISYRAMLAYPNAALWFIPLIGSLYLSFPTLFRLIQLASSARTMVFCLSIVLIVEFVYRGLSVFLLDGIPVGYGKGFLSPVTPPVPKALDRLPAEFPFQLWAPFGWGPSRVAEFAFGMVLAKWFVERRLTPHAAWGWVGGSLGCLVWLTGNLLVYMGPRGWVWADAFISGGLLFGLPAAVRALAATLPVVGRGLTQVGRLSYQLFLVHLPIMYVYAALYTSLQDNPSLQVGLALAILPVIYGAAMALRVVADGSRDILGSLSRPAGSSTPSL